MSYAILFFYSESLLNSLAIKSLVRRLPDDADILLSSQATTYLSSFSSLSQASFACLNIISQHVPASDCNELIELLSACIISTSADEVQTSSTGLTGLLWILGNVLSKVEEGDSSCQMHFLSVIDFLCDLKTQSPHQLISER